MPALKKNPAAGRAAKIASAAVQPEAAMAASAISPGPSTEARLPDAATTRRTKAGRSRKGPPGDTATGSARTDAVPALAAESSADAAVLGPKRAAKKKMAAGDTSVVPLQAPAEPRRQTKLALLVEMLKRREGATIAELAAATGWQNHSVRGAISFALKKQLGLDVASEVEKDRGRIYRIPVQGAGKRR